MAGGPGRALSGDNILLQYLRAKGPRRRDPLVQGRKEVDVELAEGNSGLVSAQRVRTEIRQMLRSPEMQHQ